MNVSGTSSKAIERRPAESPYELPSTAILIIAPMARSSSGDAPLVGDNPMLLSGEDPSEKTVAKLGHGGILTRSQRFRFPAYARELDAPDG